MDKQIVAEDSESKTCKDCIFFANKDKRGDGTCRRFPPVFDHRIAPAEKVPHDMEHLHFAFPRVLGEWWCGEYEEAAIYLNRIEKGLRAKVEVIEGEPLLAIRLLYNNSEYDNGLLIRIKKTLRRNFVSTWDQVKTANYKEWRNYGKKSHETLTKIAKTHGVDLPPW